MKCAAENFKFSLATWIENPDDTQLLRSAIFRRRAQGCETLVGHTGKLRAVARGVEGGSSHETLELAGRNRAEAAHQFASPVGLEIQLGHQVVHRQTVYPTQQALGEVASLAYAIQLEAPHLHRLAHREQTVHPQLVTLRAHCRITAALVARADRGNRDAAVGEWHGMKDVAWRGVAQQPEELDAVGQQVEADATRDREQELSQASARGVGELDKLEELRRVVLLAPRNQLRPFAVEHQTHGADPVGTVDTGMSQDRLVAPHRLEIHRKVV